jgi:ankyrin repeat protein
VAIALDRADDVRHLVTRDPSLLASRLSRGEHYRTPLHHAAAKNRPRIVRLLIDLGADPNVTDATGATPLTAAAQVQADASIVAMLAGAGAKLDFMAALNLERYELAQAMLNEDPSRLGPAGGDTIALHLAVSRKNVAAVRWLIQHGVDLDAKRMLWDCNHTALHMTTESGALDIHDDKYDATVLGWAEFCGQPQVAQLVRERGGHA